MATERDILADGRTDRARRRGGEGAFGLRARAQQARFRATLPPAAASPADDKGLRNKHLLTLGHEHQNLFPALQGPGGAVDYFSARGIQWWRSGRSGDAAGGGPTRNLASSQVACVNFLLPLMSVPGALATLVRAIDPEIIELVEIPDPSGAAASFVQLEWVGWSAPLEGGRINRGALQTSADALVLGRTAAGLRALVFEWKYCEEYRSPQNKGEGRSGGTRRRLYAQRFSASDSSFKGDIPLDDFLIEPFYQLLRLRLLADELQRSGLAPGLPVVDARVVVVCPEANTDYLSVVASTPLARRFPGRETVEEVMQATLRTPSGVTFVPSERLVRDLRASPVAPALAAWLHYQQLRYGW